MNRASNLRSPSILLYVVAEYPSRTQTFVFDELRALAEARVSIHFYALHAGPPLQRDADLAALRLGRRSGVLLSLLHLLSAPLWAPNRVLAVLRDVIVNGSWHPLEILGRLRSFAHSARLCHLIGRRFGNAPVHLHAHFAGRTAEVCRYVGMLRGESFSVTVHATDIYAARDAKALRARLADAQLIVCTADYGRRFLASKGLIVDLSKVVVIYCGVDLRNFTHAPAARRPASEAVILGVGRLVEKKGFSSLIRAMGSLVRRGYRTRCIVVGAGPLLGPLMSLVEKEQCQGTVDFPGALPYEQVLQLYRSASVFVLPCAVAPDGDMDGLPTVLMEAMAFSVPVVSTTVSGIPELVTDGETGILVPPHDIQALADAIARLVSNKSFAQRIGQAGRRVIEDERNVRRQARALLDEMERRGLVVNDHRDLGNPARSG